MRSFPLLSDMLAYFCLSPPPRKDGGSIIYQTTGVVERLRVLLSLKEKKSMCFALKSNITSILWPCISQYINMQGKVPKSQMMDRVGAAPGRRSMADAHWLHGRRPQAPLIRPLPAGSKGSVVQYVDLINTMLDVFVLFSQCFPKSCIIPSNWSKDVFF